MVKSSHSWTYRRVLVDDRTNALPFEEPGSTLKECGWHRKVTEVGKEECKGLPVLAATTVVTVASTASTGSKVGVGTSGITDKKEISFVTLIEEDPTLAEKTLGERHIDKR